MTEIPVEMPTDAMFKAASDATGCPANGHLGPRNREFFAQIYLAMRSLDPDYAVLREIRAILFEPIESDASLNLQGVADDLCGQANPNDGGVCARTVNRVIEQLESVRAALSRVRDGEREDAK